VPRESEERLRLKVVALESAANAILITDREGRILWTNPAFSQLTGYAAEEVLGKNPRLLKSDRTDQTTYLNLWETILAGRVWRGEIWNRRKDGSVYLEGQTISPVRDEQGEITHFIAVKRDITEIRRSEETRQALFEAGLAVQEPLGLQERMSRLLQAAQRVLEADRVIILLADPEGQWLEAAAQMGADEPLAGIRVPIGPEAGGLARAYLTRQPIIWEGRGPVPEDLRLKPPYDGIKAFRSRNFAIFPLVVQGRAIGVLALDRKYSRRPMEPDRLELFHIFAVQAALAIQNARLFESIREQHAQLRALTSRLAEAEEGERRRLARELHDRVGQSLTTLGINLNILRDLLSPESAAKVGPRLHDSLNLVAESVGNIRDVMAELRPPVLDDYGLPAALRWCGDQFERRTGLSTKVRGDELTPRPPQGVETALFRIAQEALTNVAKHARATQVTISLEGGLKTIRLIIADDGIGFGPGDRRSAAPGWGLPIMSERALAAGGSLRVDSTPGTGTRIVVEVPR
jgi:PAS domain S-box-containing protein